MSLEVDRKEQILIEKLKVDKANGFSKLMWVLYKDTIKECMQLYADEVGQSKQLVCHDCIDGRDSFDPDWLCPTCRQKEKANEIYNESNTRI